MQGRSGPLKATRSEQVSPGSIEFSARAISAIDPPPGPGWVVTTLLMGPMSQAKDLRNLYAQFGKSCGPDARVGGWPLVCDGVRLIATLDWTSDQGLPTTERRIEGETREIRGPFFKRAAWR